ISRASKADAAAFREFAEFLFPAGGSHNPVDALGKIDRREAKEIGSNRVRRLSDFEAKLSGIECQLLCNLIELHFLPETRLNRAVAALGPAWRFVGKRAATLKVIARHVVSDRLQRARVKRAGHAVGTISAPVNERLQIDAGNRAVLFHS